jgi:hypothetical protein
LAILGLLITGVGSLRTAVSQEPRAASLSEAEADLAGKNPFDGKFLTVIARSAPEDPLDLESVRVRPVGGALFLVGKGAKLPGYWLAGRTVWTALDDVAQIVEYDTLQELIDAAVVGDK